LLVEHDAIERPRNASFARRSRQAHAHLAQPVCVRLVALVLLAFAGCATPVAPAELVTLPAAPTGPWQVMRAAIDECAHQYGVVGEIRLRLDFDRLGRVREVDTGDGPLAGCIGNATVRARFPAYRDRAILVDAHLGG